MKLPWGLVVALVCLFGVFVWPKFTYTAVIDGDQVRIGRLDGCMEVLTPRGWR